MILDEEFGEIKYKKKVFQLTHHILLILERNVYIFNYLIFI